MKPHSIFRIARLSLSWQGILCSIFLAGPAETGCLAASNARLPDGGEFVFWEQPLRFSRTYYVDNGSPECNDNGPGTSELPFRTINKAAAILQPGERVVIASGTYRECIRPARGGTGPDRMISYEAAPGAKVVVKGSEPLSQGWLPSPRSMSDRGGGPQTPSLRHELSVAMFPDIYNPFALASVPGDWSWLDTSKVDMGPYFRRRGLVFLDGKPLEPMEQFRELVSGALRPWIPAPPPTNASAGRNGLPARNRGGALMQEIGGSPDGRFWVENGGNAIHIRLPAGVSEPPSIEITTREQAFAPQQKGLAYIRVKGIIFQHAGNGYPPPQRGLVSTAGGNHWIIEGNTIEWANGVGLDIGNGSWNGGSTPEAGASHIIRGNTIRYCGVCGICGMGTQNTVIEDNLIEWCGWADAERAWEAAGAKFHSARNLLFRRNVIRHIRHANALWLDSGNSNCRISANVFADVLTVSAAVHMEMNRNWNQIDNNVIWDVRNAEPGTPGQRGAAGSGIFEHATDRLIIAHNLIGNCDNAGVFPVLRPERRNAGTAAENQVLNNIFANCGNAAILFINPTNVADGNLYASMPSRYLGFAAPGSNSNQWFNLAEWRGACGWDTNGTQSAVKLDFDPDRLELSVLAPEPFPELAVVRRIETDIFGKATGDRRVPGPFAELVAQRVLSVDPRVAPSHIDRQP